MATETWTMTLSERQRKPNDPNLPPENERSLRACSDIVSFLVQDHEAQQEDGRQAQHHEQAPVVLRLYRTFRNGNPPLGPGNVLPETTGPGHAFFVSE